MSLLLIKFRQQFGLSNASIWIFPAGPRCGHLAHLFVDSFGRPRRAGGEWHHCLRHEHARSVLRDLSPLAAHRLVRHRDRYRRVASGAVAGAGLFSSSMRRWATGRACISSKGMATLSLVAVLLLVAAAEPAHRCVRWPDCHLAVCSALCRLRDARRGAHRLRGWRRRGSAMRCAPRWCWITAGAVDRIPPRQIPPQPALVSGSADIIRFAVVVMSVRIVLSEQTWFGAIGCWHAGNGQTIS